MKLIVGLGNYGEKYNNTRHNIGFEFLDFISNKYSLNFVKGKFNAMEAIGNINKEKIIYIKPLSFMNLSGEVVKKYVDYYSINKNDIFVIQDDLDMDIGKIRIHFNRNHGGHNGIKNIEECLKSKEFYRLKIGIKSDMINQMNIYDFVLSRFSQFEREQINKIYQKLIDIVEDFVILTKDELMNKYNTKGIVNE